MLMKTGCRQQKHNGFLEVAMNNFSSNLMSYWSSRAEPLMTKEVGNASNCLNLLNNTLDSLFHDWSRMAYRPDGNSKIVTQKIEGRKFFTDISESTNLHILDLDFSNILD